MIKSMKSDVSEMDKALTMLNYEVSVIKLKTVPNPEKELLAKITALGLGRKQVGNGTLQ